jgi:hypothetical protein
MPAVAAALFRQMNELELHKATRGTCHLLAPLSCASLRTRSTSAKAEGKNTTSNKRKGVVLRLAGVAGGMSGANRGRFQGQGG